MCTIFLRKNDPHFCDLPLPNCVVFFFAGLDTGFTTGFVGVTGLTVVAPQLTLNANEVTLFPAEIMFEISMQVFLTPIPYAYESLFGYGPDKDVEGPRIAPF